MKNGSEKTLKKVRNKQENTPKPAGSGVLFGGDWGTRTLDLMRVKQLTFELANYFALFHAVLHRIDGKLQII